MKPSFALSFTEDAIQLLHRAGKGWVVVGETPFAAPDLDEALDYMRRTALGLEPAGFATKLVIPNSQIRYMEMDAPGPSDEERRAQIRAGLEGKTPYPVDDLVFDWSGRGKLVRVAVLARETLDEAEAFAASHRFNPISFVAIPDYGDFNGEPWFGKTGAAAGLLPPGEEVERDRGAIRILTRGPRGETAPAPAAEPPAAETPAAEPPVAPQPELDLSGAAETPAEPPAAEPPLPEPVAAEPAVEEPAPAPEPEPVAAEPPAPEPSAAEAPAPETSPEAPAPEPAERIVPAAPAAAWPEEEEEKAAEALPPPPPSVPETAAEPAPPAPFEPPEPVVEEAPFAFVHDETAFPEEDDDLRAADPAPLPKPAKPADPVADPLAGDDLPPAPSQAAMVAFASRRNAEDQGRAPALGAASRPDAAALARAARGKPVEDLPPMPRPPQAGARPAAPAVGGVRSGKGIGGLVGAQGLGAGRKAAKVKPLPQPSAPARTAAAVAASSDAAKSLTRPGGTFGNRPPPKPRSRAALFLSLVAILLLCMALVAAWSTFYLASGQDEPEAVQIAGDDLPGIEDEMLADGEEELIGMETAAAGETAEPLDTAAAEETAVPAAEAAPGTAVSSDSPPAQVLAEDQDEIFLATSDTPPPALDALALPTPAAAEDTLPAGQMPPPPFGTVYAFDDQGLLIPTPEGIVNPDGVMLIAGKPPKLPPSRSEAAEAAALAAAAEAAAAVPPAPDASAAGLVEAVPFGETPAASAEGAVEAVAAEQPVGPEAQPNPDLADRRPKERPAGLAPNPDEAALTAEPEVRQASLRPRERPRTVLAAAEAARQQTETASLALAPTAEEAAQAEADLAAAAAAEAANPSVVAISRRPAARPKDFSRAVEAAVAAAIRTPEPEPEPEAPKKTAAKKKAEDLKPEEQEDEPEVVASAAPKIPSSASVAKQATFKNALNLSKVNLIGVYGTPSKRYALVRQANGKYKKVQVGDRIDGGRIEAITQNEVRYQKGGRLIALKMPQG
ncbi:translation initiation factor 2 [Rhodobacter sp. SGA-6-6]|uniref:translation initiation factor 2 n=1 Tax=Rhodobacter sp. SGA-6-6 TaxID=2710882 RepID=UPI0013E9C121|nr:translation initiation factor 2 [Rhodobacter sp. SGA-6-6]NGM45429.1 translation initiation factor 2 [Rhodobacter sp. SGA-6-6]